MSLIGNVFSGILISSTARSSVLERSCAYLYRNAIEVNINMSINMRPANRKNSFHCVQRMMLSMEKNELHLI